LDKRLRDTLPDLILVSINGADHEGGWDRLIQPLDRGDYDVYSLLLRLRQLGYQGPVGLQCYQVPGDHRENLQRSMEAWRGFVKRMAGEAVSSQKVSVKGFDEVEPLEFPWGWIRWLMNAEIDPDAEMTLGVASIKPHQSNPLHMHPNSAEYLHVLAGSLEHRLGDRWVTLKTGDTLRIPKGVVHTARTGEEACRVLVVYDTGRRQMVHVTEE
jgi:quercetin dioxygenase-like cupin family protein